MVAMLPSVFIAKNPSSDYLFIAVVVPSCKFWFLNAYLHFFHVTFVLSQIIFHGHFAISHLNQQKDFNVMT